MKNILLLPNQCRVNVFQFLDVVDVTNVACTCKTFNIDTQHPSVLQDRIITFNCRYKIKHRYPDRFFRALVDMNNDEMTINSIKQRDEEQQHDDQGAITNSSSSAAPSKTTTTTAASAPAVAVERGSSVRTCTSTASPSAAPSEVAAKTAAAPVAAPEPVNAVAGGSAPTATSIIRRKFSRFTHLQINDLHLCHIMNHTNIQVYASIINGLIIPEMKSLDLSSKATRRGEDKVQKVATTTAARTATTDGDDDDSPTYRMIPKVLIPLLKLFPNLIKLDISYMDFTYESPGSIFRATPNLQELKWNYHNYTGEYRSGMNLDGIQIFQYCHNISKIEMNHSTLWKKHVSMHEPFNPKDHKITLFDYCDDDDDESQPQQSQQKPQLISVSLKNLTIKKSTRYEETLDESLKQYTLMRFVRETPTLKYFKSDLTDENKRKLLSEFSNRNLILE